MEEVVVGCVWGVEEGERKDGGGRGGKGKGVPIR